MKEARRIIKNHDKSKPLFLYLPLMSIHSPHVGHAPQRFRHLYSSSANSGFQSSGKLREIVLATVDYALHKVFVDLKMNGMYNNSVVLVTTDNGGGPWNSNTPLKGTKETLYEGGIRGASFLSSPLLNATGYKYTGLLHITDWVPTLLGLAGRHKPAAIISVSFQSIGIAKPADIDGQDMWEALSNNQSSPRLRIIHNIDEDIEKGTWQVKSA